MPERKDWILSRRHIEEAFRAMLPDFQRSWPRWRSWLDAISGVVLGLGLQGVYTELTKPDRADWNVTALVIGFAATVFGSTVLAWVKSRQ